MTVARIAVPLALAIAFALAARAAAPRAFEAQFLFAAQDDPVALSDHAVAHSFDAAVVAREQLGLPWRDRRASDQRAVDCR